MIESGANSTRELVEQGRFEEATSEWGNTEYLCMLASHYVDFYNVLTKIPASRSKYTETKKFCKFCMLIGFLLGGKLALPGPVPRESLDYIMNVLVKEALNLDVNWVDSNGVVFDTLAGDFMRPVTDGG